MVNVEYFSSSKNKSTCPTPTNPPPPDRYMELVRKTQGSFHIAESSQRNDRKLGAPRALVYNSWNECAIQVRLSLIIRKLKSNHAMTPSGHSSRLNRVDHSSENTKTTNTSYLTTRIKTKWNIPNVIRNDRELRAIKKLKSNHAMTPSAHSSRLKRLDGSSEIDKTKTTSSLTTKIKTKWTILNVVRNNQKLGAIRKIKKSTNDPLCS